MDASLFDNFDLFRHRFIHHLHGMMAHEDVGVFILVLANALSQQEVYAELRGRLQQRFDLLSDQLSHLDDDQLQQIPRDDLSVFRALQQIGMDRLQQASSRNAGDWVLQYNPVRGLRPARNSRREIESLYQPFDSEGFHFNKLFLEKEELWRGKLGDASLRLLYNKFPFADYHLLAIFDSEDCLPQHLRRRDLDHARQLLQRLAGLQSAGIAYNSLGAYASVNHAHWQLFVSTEPYPLESDHWAHNGGNRNYPLEVVVFDNLPQAWSMVERCQQSNMAFNLLARENRVYLLRRKRQGDYAPAGWCPGFAWSEVSGNIMIAQRGYFENLDGQSIESEIARLQPHPV